jgi:hypothetical protein
VDEVRASCGPDGLTDCDPALSGRAQDASTLSTTSGILVGVGAACVATGVVLWFVLDDEPSGRASRLPDAERPGVGLVPTWGGLGAMGRF